MTKNFKLQFIFSFILLLTSILIMPLFAKAQATGGGAGASTPNTGITYECQRPGPGGRTIYGDCGYGDLIEAVKRVIDWVIVFTLGFSVVVIAYAGFNYMISGDNPGKRAEANKMLWKVVVGIFFVLAAWLIVNLVANVLVTQGIRDVTPVVTP